MWPKFDTKEGIVHDYLKTHMMIATAATLLRELSEVLN